MIWWESGDGERELKQLSSNIWRTCMWEMEQTIFGCIWEAKSKQKFGKHGKVDFTVI